jgi:hypothetical protein
MRSFIAVFNLDNIIDPSKYVEETRQFDVLGDETEIARVKDLLDNDPTGGFDDIEDKFGTLDMGYSGDHIGGFSTNEVQPEDYNEVMRRVREYFTNELKATLSPTQITTVERSYEDE